MSNISEKFVEEKEHQSRIVSLRIENFMSIKNALIEFGDSNIVSLCGYNDSGKSAVTRLLEVMFYNTYTTEHVRFIKDGETYWTGELTFSDGVVYTRTKYSDGKSLWELKKGDKVIYTNRLENGSLAALSDIPEIIEKYLGVISDELTGEELNVRRNTDKLFLVGTTGGDNYKILNSILRSEVLANASKKLNDDKNKLHSEVQRLDTVKGMLEEEYSSIDVAPAEELDRVENFIASLEDSFLKLARINGIAENYVNYKNIVIYDAVDKIDVSRIEELQRIFELCIEKTKPVYEVLTPIDTDRLATLQGIMEYNKIKNTPIYESVVSVDTERLVALQNIMRIRESLNTDMYDSLEYIDVDRAKDVLNLADVFVNYSKVRDKYNQVEIALTQAKKQLAMLSQKYNLRVCKNCGSIVY